MGGFCGSGNQTVGSNESVRRAKKRGDEPVRAKDYLDSRSLDNWRMNPQQQVDALAARGSNAVTQVNGRNVMRTDLFEKSEAEERRDDRQRAKKAETPAAVAPVVEEEETTTTPPVTPTAPVYTPPNYTNPVQTESVQEVLADQERGPKGGTIETLAQGISKDDTSGLRPKRKLKPKGLLTAETPARNQSLLAAA